MSLSSSPTQVYPHHHPQLSSFAISPLNEKIMTPAAKKSAIVSEYECSWIVAHMSCLEAALFQVFFFCLLVLYNYVCILSAKKAYFPMMINETRRQMACFRSWQEDDEKRNNLKLLLLLPIDVEGKFALFFGLLQ